MVEDVNIELYSLSITDPLTGLINRRGFYESIKKQKSIFTIAIMDIDHFKRVNDTYGHDIGDSGEEFSVTCSFGIAEKIGCDQSIDNQISRADKALYRAKESGRNRVIVAE